MTHVNNYSFRFWDKTNFLSIFAASNDTYIGVWDITIYKVFFQQQMTHVEEKL